MSVIVWTIVIAAALMQQPPSPRLGERRHIALNGLLAWLLVAAYHDELPRLRYFADPGESVDQLVKHFGVLPPLLNITWEVAYLFAALAALVRRQNDPDNGRLWLRDSFVWRPRPR